MSRSAASLVPFFTAPAPAMAQPVAQAMPAPGPELLEPEEAVAAVEGVEAVEDVATAEQELGVDPSALHADPGSEDAISLASCRKAPGGTGGSTGFLSLLGLSALLVRSRRRRSTS